MFDHYLGIVSDSENRIYMLPVPYECTVSFRTGTKEGPFAILRASYELESWDEELGVDIADIFSIEVLPYFDSLEESPEKFINALYKYIDSILKPNDFLITLGGEHTTAIAPISFYRKYYKDMVVIQLDAHADLREKYQNNPYSHACVMRRVYDMGIFFVQLGIRSLSKEESVFIRTYPDSLKTIFAWDIELPEYTADKIKKLIGKRPVYITFDVDVLDPSILPGTGTPEPGGLDFYWLTNFFKELIPDIHLLGFDVCELSPVGTEVVSESVVVRCINRILASLALSNKSIKNIKE